MPSYLSIPPSFPPFPTAFQDDAQAALLSDLVAWLHTGGSSLALFSPFDAALYSGQVRLLVSPIPLQPSPMGVDDPLNLGSKERRSITKRRLFYLLVLIIFYFPPLWSCLLPVGGGFGCLSGCALCC